MEVNLKVPQDVGANVHPATSRQGGLSVVSTAETLKPVKKDAKDGKTKVTAPQGEDPAASLTKEELQGIATELTKFMQSMNTDMQFSIHEKSGRMLVRVVDSRTEEVLKEFPPEELLDTIGAIREYVGALLDKKA